MNNLRRISKWITLTSTSVALLPVVLVLISATLANIGGCQLNEATVSVCKLGGVDIGGALSLMGISGWLALITLPVGGGIALIGLIVYVVSVLTMRHTDQTISTKAKTEF